MAGGVPAIMKELTKRDFLDLSLITCTGKTVGENLEGVVNKNPEVVRPLENPYSQTGGIAVLWGNIAKNGCVVKRSAVRRKDGARRSGTRVDCEEDAIPPSTTARSCRVTLLSSATKARRAVRACARCSTRPLHWPA